MAQKRVQIRAIGAHIESDHGISAIEKSYLCICGWGEIILGFPVIIHMAAVICLFNQRDTGGFETIKLQKFKTIVYREKESIGHVLQIIALCFLSTQRITEYDDPLIRLGYRNRPCRRFIL